MRSRKPRRPRFKDSLSDRQVQALAEDWLAQAVSLEHKARKCTGSVVWKIVLLAAARMVSLFAACRDLSGAPSDEAVRQALRKRLPKRARTLEAKLEAALCRDLPRSFRRRARAVAIDFHLIPYHGEPRRHAREVYRSQPKSGTTKFHAYATACVVEAGFRWTLAATWVQAKEPLVAVLGRLLDRLDERDIAVREVLLDRQFFATPVIALLQSRNTPFLMPAMFRGRPTKRGTKPTGLRAMRSRPAGRHRCEWTVGRQTVAFDFVVAYRTRRHRRSGRRCKAKLFYAAWRVRGSQRQIVREYHRRFGIESSYRQLGQARIRTCTTDPLLRLFFVLVALVLRNVWVWIHCRLLATHHGPVPTLHLERLRLRRLLDWIARVVTDALHDGSDYAIQLAPRQ